MTSIDTSAEPEWTRDPDTVLFVTGEEALAVGAIRPHGPAEAIGRLFGRSKEDVRADWERTLDQIQFLLEKVTPGAHGFELETITFELGFSAQGKVAFIAEAGITSSISATFTRKAFTPQNGSGADTH
jgi:hypothetical protein